MYPEADRVQRQVERGLRAARTASTLMLWGMAIVLAVAGGLLAENLLPPRDGWEQVLAGVVMGSPSAYMIWYLVRER